MKLDRRTLALSALALSLAPRAFAQTSLKDAAREMWLFGLPLIEMAATRQRRVLPYNSLTHARQLSGPAAQAVTTPNNDTLYSTAWLQVTSPITLTVPDTGKRYFSVAFMDMYTNNFAIIGTRTTGGKALTFTLLPPGSPDPKRPNTVVSPTRYVWMLGRTLVESQADLPKVYAVQNAIKLTAPAAVGVPVPAVARDAPWQSYFATVQKLIAENPAPAMDAPLFARASALGVANGPGGFDAARFTPDEGAQIAAGVAQAQSEVRNARLSSTGSIGVASTNYLERARIALSGLAALPREEAVYMRIANPAGETAITGAVPYRLHFAKADLPPAGAFWSLSMYRVTPEGQMYFAENPINRYAIGDRTPGLKWNADGSLDIWIGTADPGAEKRSNWLPAPASGPFAVTLRGYLPKKAMLDGTYKAPGLTRV